MVTKLLVNSMDGINSIKPVEITTFIKDTKEYVFV
jgi:hypothetical protein